MIFYLFKISNKYCFKFCLILCLAFPNDQYVPSEIPETPLHPSIPANVVIEFRLPVLRPGLRTRRSLATGMAMPKASMNKDDLAPRGEDEVGRAGEVASVQTEAIAERVGQAADAHFRFRVLAANARHERAASRVHH